ANAGIPAVLGAAGATTAIPDGARIQVMRTTGAIAILRGENERPATGVRSASAGRVDDENSARRLVRDGVRHAPEHSPLPSHPFVAEDDEISAEPSRDVDDRHSRLAGGRVDLYFDIRLLRYRGELLEQRICRMHICREQDVRWHVRERNGLVLVRR